MKNNLDLELFEDKKLKETNKFIFKDLKTFIYVIIFYGCGLFLGSDFYKLVQSEKLNSILAPSNNALLNDFTSNLCIYMSIFLVAVFLGFCLIGYPIINFIPLILGIHSGLEIGYFLLNYGTKGISYSVLMIIPFEALFVTVITFTINTSTQLSKNILQITKAENKQEFSAKEHLKAYLIYGILIVAVAFINAALTKLLCSVVTI